MHIKGTYIYWNIVNSSISSFNKVSITLYREGEKDDQRKYSTLVSHLRYDMSEMHRLQCIDHPEMNKIV